MTNDDTQRPNNGWVPPEIRPERISPRGGLDRLPPYAPRPRHPESAEPPVVEPSAGHSVVEPTVVEPAAVVEPSVVEPVAPIGSADEAEAPQSEAPESAAAESMEQAIQAEAVEPADPAEVAAAGLGHHHDPAEAKTEMLAPVPADDGRGPWAPESAAAALSEPPLLSGAGNDAETRWIPTIDNSGSNWGAGDTDEPEVLTAGRGSKKSRNTKPDRPKDPIRTIARGVGQTLISLGVVVLLFVVYEVYITDIFGAQKQAAAQEQVNIIWEQAHASEAAAAGGTATATATATASAAAVPPEPEELAVDPETRAIKYETNLGDAFAKIFIPAFGPDYSFAIVEGTNADDLYIGPGHYEDSQLPGELGNFAVAGHRVSKGSPFNELGDLTSCEALVVETQDDWFIYRVLPMQDQIATWNPRSSPACADVKVQEGAYANVFGREITLPSDYAQVHAVPKAPTNDVSQATERMITLTTCHPQFSDAERMIIHGVLVKSYAKADGFLPPELQEG